MPRGVIEDGAIAEQFALVAPDIGRVRGTTLGRELARYVSTADTNIWKEAAHA